MASQETSRNRKERRARAKQGQDPADIPLARPQQQAPKGKTLLELAEERQLLQRSKNDEPVHASHLCWDGDLCRIVASASEQ
ncbi:hypothetical protein Q9189_008086 [Teloschistes chrysophthalmus]